MMRRLLPVTVLAALLVIPAAASAVPLTFEVQGQSNAGLLGDIDFSYNQATHQITIDITNTSTLAGGTDPRMTAFAFNAPSAVTGVSAFSSSPLVWNVLFSPNGIDTPTQIGLFDIGAESDNNGNWNGNSANNGIPRGATNHFTFTLQGDSAALSALTAESFLSLNSQLMKPQNGTSTYFAVRFQRTGANGEGSDVAIPGGPPTGGGGGGGGSVPEPFTLALLGLGGAALLGRHARRMTR